MSGSDGHAAGPRGAGLSLVGYRGTGKTTVGRLVADGLRLPFIDADARLVARDGRPVARIFAEDGEPRFRDLEEATLAELVAGPPSVVATGGGAILREANRDALRRFGRVVWLTAAPDVLADRLARDASSAQARPSLTGAGLLGEIAAVLEARTPWYRAAADLVVPTDGRTPAEVAEAVLRALDAPGRPAGTERTEPSTCS